MEEVKKDHSLKYLFNIIILLIIFTTFVLPSDILDIIPTLEGFVRTLASVIPAIGYYRDYLDFPQLAQVVYIIGVISSVIAACYTFSFFEKKPEINISLNNKPFSVTIFSLLVIFAILFIFPGKPNGSDNPNTLFVRLVYQSKLAFALFNSLLFAATSLIAGIFVNYLNYIIRVSNKGGK